MDESGEHISEYDHDVYKERLGQDGKSIIKEKSEGKKTASLPLKYVILII